MRGAWQAWLYASLCVVIAVCIAALSTRFGFTSDWSAGARATIPSQTRSLLGQLQGPVHVLAYARPGTARAQARTLVARYQRFKHDMSLKFIDPDLDPVATQDANVTANGELVIDWRGHGEHVTHLDQRTFSDALVRLARGGPQLVAFVTGNGERDATGKGAADLGDFVARLATRGVRALPLNLAEAAEVPRNASLVVLASPQAALLPGSVKKFEDYLANGGNLLWLTEPGAHALGLGPLYGALDIKPLPGTLFDAQSARDPRMLVSTRYPPQAITDGFNLNTVFPRAAPLAALSGAQWSTHAILQSSAHSVNRIGATDASASTGLDPAPGELKGPLTFGYALSRLSPSPARNQQRAVVIGGGSFLSNAYLAHGGNDAFGQRVVDWLLGDDALASLPPPAPDALVKPTRTALGVLTFGYLLALPLVLIVLGFTISGWRRRR